MEQVLLLMEMQRLVIHAPYTKESLLEEYLEGKMLAVQQLEIM